MDASRKTSLEQESNALRAELKVWEHQWSKEHDGAKPSRQAIKECSEIARKYKQYNKLRDILSGKLKDDAPPKRKSQHVLDQTPVKKSKYSHTRTETQSSIPCPITSTPAYDRTAPSPAVPTSIGPTPHRDGKVLGLFAFLDDKTQTTPSKGTGQLGTEKLLETPSKAGDLEDFKLGKTPVSMGKRRFLNNLVTPLKDTDGNAHGGTTPKSVSKLHFGTPAFLRRRPLPPVVESGEYTSPPKFRLKRKPFARGLSDIVANLRKVEEEAFDEDEEAMREMEAESAPGPNTANPKPASTSQPHVLVPDSQLPALLGGFDEETAYDKPADAQLDRGRPMKEYKKKAPKRTTRKVNMRPTRFHRPVEDDQPRGDSDGEDVVPETQLDPTKTAIDGPDSDFDPLGDEDEDGNYDEKQETGNKRKRTETKAKTDAKEETAQKDKAAKEKDSGRVKKAAKKVNELAHANFKRLKLKNHGAKGGPGFNSRFRRRR